MNLIYQSGKTKGLKAVAKRFFNLVKPQAGLSKENKSEKFLRDGVRNDYPDYLIRTVHNSPNAITAMRRLQSFIEGRGIAEDDIADMMANPSETFAEVHEKIAKDFAFSERFAVRIVPNRNGSIDSIYHIPFEAVRFGLPDESGMIKYIAVNHLFNTFDYRPSDTRHYPIFEPRKGLKGWAIDASQKEIDFPDQGEYTGHVYFYSATSEKDRTYSRPAYFASKDYMKTDYKLGAFHDRNTENNFFLGGILSVVGDPDAVIYNEDGSKYSTAGEEFDKQLSNTFSGADNAGKYLVDWVDAPEDATKIQGWPGNTNHELFTILETICEDRIFKSVGIPKILAGSPTAGKLGDSQEIRNAISYTNENTESKRRKLEDFYNTIVELMGATLPEDGVKIERIRDFTDLSDSIVAKLSPSQLEKYLMENYGIEPSEEVEVIEESEPNIIEDGNTTDSGI